MITVEELELFGPFYDCVYMGNLKWWWKETEIVARLNDNDFVIRIDLSKLPTTMSLTKLLVRLKHMALKRM